MTQKHLGGWIVDPEAGTATAGDLVVTVVPQGDGAFAVRFSGAVLPEDHRRSGVEAGLCPPSTQRAGDRCRR
ncbi:hypothetical protein [Novosphingobium sp. BL-52-GroH]|uniref:hypothetical protein n=1 Tax=Novosphingobium sp. BL-52-GroH TaxID=3349877 RepID=UPI00384F4077